MSLLASATLAFLCIIVPGFSLSYALLGKTKMHLFEIVVIGFIFGMIFPPALTWFESYFMFYIHAFTFSAGLFEANAVVLTIIGLFGIWYQGLFKPGSRVKSKKAATSIEAEGKEERIAELKELRQNLASIGADMKVIREHEAEEARLQKEHAEEIARRMASGAGPVEIERVKQLHEDAERRLLEDHEREERLFVEPENPKKEENTNMNVVWAILALLMLLTFVTRILNISDAPTFFEFDPYFDLLSTESILVHGYQYLHDYSAWPVLVNGSNHRMQPLMPYLEAFGMRYQILLRMP